MFPSEEMEWSVHSHRILQSRRLVGVEPKVTSRVFRVGSPRGRGCSNSTTACRVSAWRMSRQSNRCCRGSTDDREPAIRLLMILAILSRGGGSEEGSDRNPS